MPTAQLNRPPLKIHFAPNGGYWRKTSIEKAAGRDTTSNVSDYVPITVDEVMSDCEAAYKYVTERTGAGGIVIHPHVRNPESGLQDRNAEYSLELNRRLTDLGDALVLVDGSVKGDALKRVTVPKEEGNEGNRIIDLERYLEVRANAFNGYADGVVNFSTEETGGINAGLNGGDSRGVTNIGSGLDVIEAYQRKIVEELNCSGRIGSAEITTWPGSKIALEWLAERGLLPERMEFIVLAGYTDTMPIAGKTVITNGKTDGTTTPQQRFNEIVDWLDEFRTKHNIKGIITAGTHMPPVQANLAVRPETVWDWIIENPKVDCLRLGLEDCPRVGNKQLTNMQSLRYGMEYMLDRGVRFDTSPSNLRKAFGYTQDKQMGKLGEACREPVPELQ